MAMDAGEIERLIKARIPDAEVTIRDLAGDGDHYAATVISRVVPRQIARAAAPDRLRGAQGRHGRRAARAGAADRHAGAVTFEVPGTSAAPVSRFEVRKTSLHPPTRTPE